MFCDGFGFCAVCWVCLLVRDVILGRAFMFLGFGQRWIVCSGFDDALIVIMKCTTFCVYEYYLVCSCGLGMRCVIAGLLRGCCDASDCLLGKVCLFLLVLVL